VEDRFRERADERMGRGSISWHLFNIHRVADVHSPHPRPRLGAGDIRDVCVAHCFDHLGYYLPRPARPPDRHHRNVHNFNGSVADTKEGRIEDLME